MHTYTFKTTPGIQGAEVSFRRLELLDLLGRFPELLALPLPSPAGKRTSQPAETVSTDEATERFSQMVVRLVNAAVPDLAGRLHSDWNEMPKAPDGSLLRGHFHLSQLGLEDVHGLFWAVLDAAGLSEKRIEDCRAALEHPGMAETLYAMARHAGTPPAALLGLAPGDPLGYSVALTVARFGVDLENQTARALAQQQAGNAG